VRQESIGSSSFTKDLGVAYAMLRITMGVNFFFHGATRLPHLDAFVRGTVHDFAATGLPPVMVLGFAYAIPFIEVILGLAILFGIGLPIVLPLTSAYMIVLMFGTIVRGAYPVVAEQLTYSLVFAILIALRSFDRLSIDRHRTNRAATDA
jgi:thiosulfate dehydrogenase [quinone] large subunit